MSYLGVRHKRNAITIEIKLHGPGIPNVEVTKLKDFMDVEIEPAARESRKNTAIFCSILAGRAIERFGNNDDVVWAECIIDTGEYCMGAVKETSL